MMAKSLCAFLCVCLSVEIVVCQFGFFPQRENRHNGFLGQGFLQGSRRIKDRFQGFFNGQPNRPAVMNPEYNNYNGQDFGRPVSFPTNNPVYYENEQNNGNVNFGQPSYDYGQVYTQEQPAQDGGGNSGYQDQGNVRPSEETVVPEENDPVNFEDAPRESQDSTTLPPLTALPALPALPVVNTESRNSFNFQPNQGVFSDPCQTVEGGAGNCISVYECQPYLAVLQESRSNPNAVQLLRKAHCGFEGNAPKVCCPLPGIPDTPAPPPPTPAPPPPTPAPTPPPTEAPTQPEPTAAPKTDSGDFVAELPEPPVCGTSNATFSRVVGGVPAKLGDFPWMALLGYMSKRTGTTNWLCGGSLISSRHVLTAAHCIHNHETDLYVVRLGELDLAREDEGATPVDVLIKKKIKHAEYSATAFTDDIGILLLDHDVTFSDLIRPICIPKDTQLRSNTFEDYNPMIAGWGHTEFRGPAATHLQVLQLPVVSNDYCTQAYSAYKVQKIDGRVLCAGFKQGGKDACQGDSGGPLMQPIWNQVTLKTFFYQIGVVSYGKKCAEANFPGVYSRVTHFVPWIEEQVLGYSSST